MDLLLNAQENFFLKWIIRLCPGGSLLPRGVLCIPAFPLQLSPHPAPPTWNMVLPPNLHDTPWSTYKLLYHPWPALPDGVSLHVNVFPFLPLLLMLVTSAHPALSDMPGGACDQEADCVSVTGLVIQPWWQPSSSRGALSHLKISFSGGRPECACHAAPVLMLTETWACLGHQPWRSWKCHTFQDLSSFPGFGLCSCCSRLSSALHSSQSSATQGPLNSCMDLWLPAFGHSVTPAEMFSQSSTDSPTFHPSFKPQFQFYFLCKSFPMHATHRGLTFLEPHGTCCPSHVEFSTFSFYLIIYFPLLHFHLAFLVVMVCFHS